MPLMPLILIPLRSTTPYLLVCGSQTKFISLFDFTIAFPLSVCCLVSLTRKCIQRHLPLSSVRLPLKPRLTFGIYGGSSRTYVSRYLERRTGDSQTLWWMVTYVRYHFPPPTESKQSKCVFFPLADVRRLHVVCISWMPRRLCMQRYVSCSVLVGGLVSHRHLLH